MTWEDPEADLRAAVEAIKRHSPGKPVIRVPRWIAEMDGYEETAKRLGREIGATFEIIE